MSTQQLPIAQAVQLAQQYQRQGKLQQAESMYLQILRAQPKNADAWHLLGLLVSQAGNHDAAAKCILKAIALNDQVANYRVSLGNAMLALGKIDQALECYQQAQQLNPDSAEAHYNIAVLLQNQGRFADAIDAYRRALRYKPDFVEAYCNLGSLLQAQHRFDEAEACYRNAISFKPQFVIAHYNLGTVYRQQRRLDEAADCFREVIRTQSDYAAAYDNLAGVLDEQRKFDAAIQTYRAALAANIESADIQLNLGTLLLTQGKQREAIACYREVERLKPEYREGHSNLLFTLLYSADYSPEELFAEHREFGRRFEAHLNPARHRNHSGHERRLRIGYNSYDFGDHAVAWFLEPLLANHDHARFEIYCYANRESKDGVKQRIMTHADHWRSLEGTSDEIAAEMIRRDEIDILIDLSGHSSGNRIMIFAHKPAPIQATWLGYLHSSGLSGIDYRITDCYADPPGMTERFHNERLLRLPDSQWCYSARPNCPEPSRLPALANGYLTFGSFNNLAKVTPKVLDLWARLLVVLPSARLVMLAVTPGQTEQGIKQVFAAHGIAGDRLTFLPKLPLYEYMEQYRQVDVALDTFPYNGGTTSCDTLWMGVPLISLAGAHSIARGGVSVLSALDLGEFIAATTEQYVAIGACWAERIEELSVIRMGLRERMLNSPLMDAKRFTANMEIIYRQIWQHWCATNDDAAEK